MRGGKYVFVRKITMTLSCLLTCLHRCKCQEKDECDRATGNCLIDCKEGFYGPNCQKRCSPNCQNETRCDSSDGACTNGCKTGFYSPRCTAACSENCVDKECSESGQCKECTPGYFGATCKRSCSAGCKDSQCERDRGHCAACTPGYFGDYCESKCHNCAGDGACDKATEECLTGCEEGFRGSTCVEERHYLLPKLIFFLAVMACFAAALMFTFCSLKTADEDQPETNNDL